MIDKAVKFSSEGGKVCEGVVLDKVRALKYVGKAIYCTDMYMVDNYTTGKVELIHLTDIFKTICFSELIPIK